MHKLRQTTTYTIQPKMNTWLKEIAGVCEIEKELTFDNVALQTFATTDLPMVFQLKALANSLETKI
jgi:hypothetical protein